MARWDILFAIRFPVAFIFSSFFTFLSRCVDQRYLYFSLSYHLWGVLLGYSENTPQVNKTTICLLLWPFQRLFKALEVTVVPSLLTLGNVSSSVYLTATENRFLLS